MLLLLLSGCQTTARRETVPFQSEPWKFGRVKGQRLTTQHYEIYTTIQDPILVQALPDFVEAAYANYRRLLPATREPTERMPVYLFATRGQWEAFTRRLVGERAPTFLKVRNGGFSEGGVSVIEYVAHQVTFPLFAHEGFHQYVYFHVQGPLPAWLNEGIAVACEGQRWGNETIEEFDAWYNPQRRNDLADALARNRLYSLRKLLQIHAGEVMDDGPRSIATYYGQVWALVLFLSEGAEGKYAEQYAELLASLGDDLAERARAAHIWSERQSFNFGEAVFQAFFPGDLATFEQEYVAFMRERFMQ
jgi:hypothetical protein